VLTADDGNLLYCIDRVHMNIYATTALHAGLIIIVPNLGRAMQAELFWTALDAVMMPDDLVNRVLEVSLDGEEITLDLYDLS
jgi:hypothetical protein